MEKIKKLADEIMDELHSAKEYAEEYLTFKASTYKPDSNEWATRYKQMSEQELQHARYIHDRVVEEIEELRKVYTPPEEMMETWEADHKKYIEKAAWIRQMLAM